MRETPVPPLKLTYAITPPNQTTPVERRRGIAVRHSERIGALPIDALLVYDLQDETARNPTPRPFPFVPKVDALSYAFEELQLGPVPRVVYRAIADQQEATLGAWADRLASFGGLAVCVGTPTRRSGGALTLPQAYKVCQAYAPQLPLGGVFIAERHQKTRDEDVRVWDKVQGGCRFFVSQTMWSAGPTKRLLTDLQKRAEAARQPMPTLLLTLSPCGSPQTLAFQQWLGVDVPLAVQRELTCARDMLECSVELSARVFSDVYGFALERGISVGCNVESVSSRTSEVEASLELLERVARIQGAARAEQAV